MNVYQLALTVLLGTSVWVAFDAVGRDFSKNRMARGPVGWFFGCVLLWVVFFPAYLAIRGRYPRSEPGKSEIPVRPIVSPFAETSEPLTSAPAEQGEVSTPTPTYALFDPNRIAGATFLGSPLAGASLMAINYRRLGESSAAWVTILFGVAATVALMGLSMVLDSAGSMPALVLVSIGAWVMAKRLQGPAWGEHVKRGGKKASGWALIGVVVVCIVVVLGGGIAFAHLTPGELGRSASISPVEEVYYSGQASEEDARKLGELLKTAGFFDAQNEKTVTVRKEGSTYTVSFVLIKDYWKEPEVISVFQQMGESIAHGFGRPLRILLCDEKMAVGKTIVIN